MRQLLAALAVLALGCGAGSPTVPEPVQSSYYPTPAPAELGQPTVYAPPTPEPAAPKPGTPEPTAAAATLECHLEFVGRDYLNTGSIWSASWFSPQWSLVRGRWIADLCSGAYGGTGYMGTWRFVVPDSCGTFQWVSFSASAGNSCKITPRTGNW